MNNKISKTLTFGSKSYKKLKMIGFSNSSSSNQKNSFNMKNASIINYNRIVKLNDENEIENSNINFKNN